MTNNDTPNGELLFCKWSLNDLLNEQIRKIVSEINSMDPHTLLDTSPDKLVPDLVNRFSLDVPVIDMRHIEFKSRETQVKANPRILRAGINRQSCVPGISIIATLPFSGDYELFHVQPTESLLSSPRATIAENQLILTTTGVNSEVDEMQNYIHGQISGINSKLDQLRLDFRNFNDELCARIQDHVLARQQNLGVGQALVSRLTSRFRDGES